MARTTKTPPAGAWRALATAVLGRPPRSGIEMVSCLNAEKPGPDGIYDMAWEYAGEEDGASLFRGVRDRAGQTRRVLVEGGAR